MEFKTAGPNAQQKGGAGAGAREARSPPRSEVVLTE